MWIAMCVKMREIVRLFFNNKVGRGVKEVADLVVAVGGL